MAQQAFVPKMIVKITDRQDRLLKRLAAKERRVLFRTGFFGRAVMRRMIRRRKKKSPPGQPPHAHAPGATGMKDVRFRVDIPRGQVLIGHIKYRTRSRVSARKPVPQLLNEGGRAVFETVSSSGERRFVPWNFRPRPFREKALNITHRFMLDRLKSERL